MMLAALHDTDGSSPMADDEAVDEEAVDEVFDSKLPVSTNAQQTAFIAATEKATVAAF